MARVAQLKAHQGPGHPPELTGRTGRAVTTDAAKTLMVTLDDVQRSSSDGEVEHCINLVLVKKASYIMLFKENNEVKIFFKMMM